MTRQLFDRPLARLGEAGRARLLVGAAALAAPVLGLAAPPAPSSIDPEFAVRHGLTWLLAGLAERRPILLVLDDAQWADAPALRWLAYLAPRLDQLPVVVLLARRSGEAGADDPALDALCGAGGEIQLAPLSDAAVAELARARAGLAPDPDLVEKCVSASGGNPFLLDATLAALDEEGIGVIPPAAVGCASCRAGDPAPPGTLAAGRDRTRDGRRRARQRRRACDRRTARQPVAP